MNYHNNPSPIGLVAQLKITVSTVQVSKRPGFESCSDLIIFRSPFAIAVIISALKVKIKTKITSYQLILDRGQ